MNKVLLIILDGFGEGKLYHGNAITLAKMPILAELKKKYLWTLLKASGEAVGVPAGTQGGSEVGHFTIGAGRIVFQSLEEINISIKDEGFFKKPALIKACKVAKKGSQSALHLIGMISDQGVHSHIDHLFALLELAKREGVAETFIHAITDGRDVHERSAIGFIEKIQNKIRELGMEKKVFIGTIIGRYFAMDRDSNWNRTQTAYDLYTLGKGKKEKDPVAAIQKFYDKHPNDPDTGSDYYIEPIIIDEHSVIKYKDSVIFWNYRTDRSRQLTRTFTGESDPKTGQSIGFKPEKTVRPYFVCMGDYSHKAPVVFPTPIVKNNLAETLSKAKIPQFRLAETEKYAHVTYFFNSQIEAPFPLEDRLMVDSPKCPSYAEKPEMSARGVTKELLPRIESKEYGFIAVNFANCDLVGHSGNLKATIKAVEVVDECLGKIIPVALKNSYVTLITGDHGNAEYMIYEDSGEPCPSHTTNPVPLIIVSSIQKTVSSIGKSGELKDIAPTILQIMGIEKPKEMTGKSLLK